MFVNDVTELNPIRVNDLIKPMTIADVCQAVKNHRVISIGGGRFSMGGQIATEESVHIDMRGMNQILAFNPAEKTIRVQAGVRWRQIQEYIDAHGLAVKIMQTYANFTVGGSLSVNAHGRYVGQGPLILSVQSIVIVLANGEAVNASPTENSELFFGAIGGYGGLGIIVEATLHLVPNVKVERQQIKLNINDYRQYFFEHVRENQKAIFHNADLYPPHYKKARAITWVETDKPLTTPESVVKPKSSYALERYFVWAITSTPLGKWRREYIIDPLLLMRDRVVYRNLEASGYDVAELEPRSRKKYTYVLQEYFIPVMQFDIFAKKITEIMQRYNVNALNISVRHARVDLGSVLAWAREEVFAFVLYYKQGVGELAKNKVAIWTRELIDAAISVGGSYYLPYQLHATAEQFHKAYPRARDFFALKQKLDPENKFRNKLWDKYYLDNSKKENVMSNSEFKKIYSDTVWRDKFYLFLQNIYNIFPEDKFHALIEETTAQHATDQEIYQALQKKLPGIKPFLADLRYAVPALLKQKKEIARQTLELLGDKKRIDGYMEIGSTGRYISELKKHCQVKEPIYLVNEETPTYSPVDIVERGQLTKLGTYIPLHNYIEIKPSDVKDASLDLVTCYIGLHHIPRERFDNFVHSIYRVLKPGGIFIVRDHDVTNEDMRTFVSLVHTVFNAGLNVSWENNGKELRHFISVDELTAYLKTQGFRFSGKGILQDHDPSLNTLLKFIKV